MGEKREERKMQIWDEDGFFTKNGARLAFGCLGLAILLSLTPAILAAFGLIK